MGTTEQQTAHREQAVRAQFENLNLGTAHGKRAPNKPLLLLLALAGIQQSGSSKMHFREAEEPLKGLLASFGSAKTRHPAPELPFWHLQNDGIWTVSDLKRIERKAGGNKPKLQSLRKVNPTGRFTDNIEDILTSNQNLVTDIANTVLQAHFAESIHSDIASQIGLDIDSISPNPTGPRSPTFRKEVLQAYNQRCAICGFDLRIGTADIALEAAHIKWHQAGGPDVVSNGLALCNLHHKMLDRGAITITVDHRLLVSDALSGSRGLKEHLKRYVRMKIGTPNRKCLYPGEEFINWHHKEVFRGEPQDL
jgi:putative restriction endonuclease